MDVPKDPCFSCFWRADSKRRVDRWRERGGHDTGGLPADPAPKSECKRHEGYGVEPEETREYCRDYKPAVPAS